MNCHEKYRFYLFVLKFNVGKRQRRHPKLVFYFRRKDRYDWEPRSAKPGGNRRDDINGFNNKMSGETGVL
jgi:hypothetical protein